MAVIMEMKKRRSWHGEGSKVKPSADKERIFIRQNENPESPLVGTDTYSFFKGWWHWMACIFLMKMLNNLMLYNT